MSELSRKEAERIGAWTLMQAYPISPRKALAEARRRLDLYGIDALSKKLRAPSPSSPDGAAPTTSSETESTGGPVPSDEP